MHSYVLCLHKNKTGWVPFLNPPLCWIGYHKVVASKLTSSNDVECLNNILYPFCFYPPEKSSCKHAGKVKQTFLCRTGGVPNPCSKPLNRNYFYPCVHVIFVEGLSGPNIKEIKMSPLVLWGRLELLSASTTIGGFHILFVFKHWSMYRFCANN